MAEISPRQLARQSYETFAAGDRKFFERHLAEDSLFPVRSTWDLIAPDILSDAGPVLGSKVQFFAAQEHDDEVVVAYEMTKPNGDKVRNTEILRIENNKIVSAEVYFGWDIPTDG